MSMKKMLAVVAAASLVAVAAPAFAANPFSDVPMNHWAYDAVEQMAAKGILEGYPNGTFKGNRAMTRYEIAQMVARMMANGVGGADADKLKALIVEFAPELEALGVKVDGFDGRLTKLEEGVGGWKLSGQMRFDFRSDDWGKNESSHGFSFNRARLFLHKDMAQGVSVDLRWHAGRFDRFWITAKDFLGWQGFTMKAGQFALDWMGDDKMFYNHGAAGVGQTVGEDDAWVMDHGFRGVDFSKSFGKFYIEAFAASDTGNAGIDRDAGDFTSTGGEYYGARLKFDLGKFWLSGNMLITKATDGDYGSAYTDQKIYWVGAGTQFGGFGLKGAYMWQKRDNDVKDIVFGDYTVTDTIGDANAWKIVLDVNQDVLKFTSLWVEFQKMDKGFYTRAVPSSYAVFAPTYRYAGVMAFDTEIFTVGLRQQWNKKFNTYERYTQYKYKGSVNGEDDAGNPVIATPQGKDKEFVIGIGYAYSPNLYFDLSYNKLEYADNTDDKAFRFRTILNF